MTPDTCSNEILAALTALFKPGDVVELRILGILHKRSTTIAGYFDNFEKFAQTAKQWSGTPGIEGLYWTLNPCNPALLARCSNNVKEGAKVTTSDKDIRHRTHLLVDLDFVRPAGISATKDEKNWAAVVAKQVKEYLTEKGWPDPFKADSGNGYHLIYNIDLPNDETSRDLVQACLEALAGKFDIEGKVKVDKTVYNASRISKVYGSLAAKGDSTPERPHRYAHLHLPEQPPTTVSLQLLEALAAEAPPRQKSTASSSNRATTPERMEEFLTAAQVGYRERVAWDGGWKWLLNNCPFNEAHTATSVFVGINNDGALVFHCSHNECYGNKWEKFRAVIEEKLGHKFQFVDFEPRVTVEDEPDLPEVTRPYPPFPRLIGVLDELAQVIAPSLAYEQKALAIMTIVGLNLSINGVSLVTDPWLQPRFYAAGISPAGQTKSGVDKEVRRALLPRRNEGSDSYPWPPLPGPEISVEFSMNSGPSLVQRLSETPNLLLSPDELAGLFEKARSTSSSPNTLFNEMLRLYESNETGRNVVQRRGEQGGHLKITNAHLAIYGGATPESFEKMWQGTGGQSAGLQSRFVLAYSDCPLPAFQKLTDDAEVCRLMKVLSDRLREVPKKLTMTADAQQLIHEWYSKHDRLPARALDSAKKSAMTLASTGELRCIDTGAMAYGLGFADYQIDIKERLMPSDASTSVQAFENRIISIYKRNGQATLHQLLRALHPERYAGGFEAYERAVSSLLRSGKLRTCGKTRSNTKIYELD